MTIETETNSVLNNVKQAFAPVTEAFTKLQNHGSARSDP